MKLPSFTKLETGNVLIAISFAGLLVLNVLPLSLFPTIILAVLLCLVGIIGKYIDEVEDDKERLSKYEEHLKTLHRGDTEKCICSDPSCTHNVPCSVRNLLSAISEDKRTGDTNPSTTETRR